MVFLSVYHDVFPRSPNWSESDGSNLTRLTYNGGYGPTFSPDGTKIAFYSERDGNREIYTMTAYGEGLTLLTENSAHDRWPTWSPDGNYIAFASDRDGNHEIYVMDADGTDQMTFTKSKDNEGGRSALHGGQNI